MSDEADSKAKGIRLDSQPTGTDIPTVVTPPTGASAASGFEAPIPAQRPTTSSPDLPQRLGRYTLTKRLGVGGMAEVFRATQDGVGGFQKTVVVKRILPHLAEDPRFIDMFFREAKVAADLAHPNIIQVHELGEDGGTYFIVMEYLKGLSLFQVARRAWRAERSLPMELAVFAIADAAEGLNFAWERVDDDGHRLNLVHRDISPDNLMITTAAVTKVLDFGIAKAADSENLTKTGEMKGKIPYMPREVLEPEGIIDHRSDLYALGIALYWLLTGRRPFHGATDLRLMQAIVAGNPKRPRSYNASIPPALEEITLSLIEADRHNRPENGHVVANELLSLVSAQRDQVGRFVIEMMQQPALRTGEKPITTTGFLPAVPITGTLAAAQHTKPPPDELGFDVEFTAAETSGPVPPTPAAPGVAMQPVDVDAAGQQISEELSGPRPVSGIVTGAGSSSSFAEPAHDPEVSGPLAAAAGLDDDVADVFAVAPATESAAKELPAPRSRAPVVLAAAVAAVFGIGGGLFLLGGTPDEDLPPPPPVSSDDPPADPAPNADPSTPGDPAGPQDPADPKPEAQRATPDEQGTKPIAEEKGEPASVADPPEEAEPSTASKERSRSRRSSNRTASRAPRTMTIKAAAPKFVRWMTTSGKPLGRGAGNLEAPAGTRQVLALDNRRGVKSPATVKAGAVDYAAIPTGTLVLRVFPFADMVTLGKQKLGPAPIKPKKLKVGSYKLSVKKGDKVIEKTATVEAGRTEVVKVIFK